MPTYHEVGAAGPTIAERLFAFNLAAKYSIGTVKGVTEDELRDRISQTLEFVHDMIGVEAYRRALPRLRRIWKGDPPPMENTGRNTGNC